VDRNLLFNLLPELENYAGSAPDAGTPQTKALKHLTLLINCIKSTYKETMERLDALLAKDMITYDLLWALFKPGERICTVCRGTGKPRSLVYNSGEEKKAKQGVEYFQLAGHYFDFDGEVFGEVGDTVCINKFHGAVPLTKLAAFPLQYHPTREAMETHLRDCGVAFTEMMAGRHCHYRGVAFFEEKDGTISRMPVDGRIIVDASQFQKVNPGYPRLQDKVAVLDIFSGTSTDHFSERVKCTGKHPSELSEDDLLVCAPTVLGFSLSDKFWGEISH
jgi:hypothetical protein